jgi:YegS/Rv2252/BmrU family lipid kinase
MPTIEVIINAGSGSVLGDETASTIVADSFREIGVEVNIRVAENGDDIERLLRKAVESDAEIIVAGGGDGTISGVAVEVHKAGKTLGVLPLGTLNNFSKDLGIPQDIAEAVRVIADGHTRTIDLAEVNGRIFINNSSIGLYPRMVRKREKQQRLGRGKWISALWASLRMFKLSPFLKVSIKIDNKQFLRKTPFVFVGNNEYDMDVYNIGRRNELDKGKLGVYFLHRGGRWGVVMMLVRTAFGRLKQWRDFEIVTTDEITIKTRRRRVHVAFDGEVDIMRSPLVYKSIPAALKVIVPRAETRQ